MQEEIGASTAIGYKRLMGCICNATIACAPRHATRQGSMMRGTMVTTTACNGNVPDSGTMAKMQLRKEREREIRNANQKFPGPTLAICPVLTMFCQRRGNETCLVCSKRTTLGATAFGRRSGFMP